MVSNSVAVAVVAIVLGVRYLLPSPPNKELLSHRPGPCRQIPGSEVGSEDVEIVVQDDKPIAFISSGLHYLHSRPGIQGNILRYDFEEQDGSAKPLKIVADPKKFDRDAFEPHGISSWRLDATTVRIFVVNHNKVFNHSIELFDWSSSQNTLKHVKTLRHPTISRPNDLVALGPEKFIVTNDGASQTGFWNTIEVFTRYKGGSVVLFDGKDGHYLIPNEAAPNGLAVDSRKSPKFLYVSLVNLGQIGVYQLSEDLRTVKEIRRVQLDTIADNLLVAEDGAIWSGAHPSADRLFEYIPRPDDRTKRPAPGQVIRLKFSDKTFSDWKITEPYADGSGDESCASATAAPFGDHLLIGSVFRSLVHCRMLNRATYE